MVWISQSLAPYLLSDPIIFRTLDDRDGPVIAKKVYEEVFAKPTIDADLVPYVLDEAAQHLRRSGVPPERWATFVHMGA
jgi:hypothetical protein